MFKQWFQKLQKLKDLVQSQKLVKRLLNKKYITTLRRNHIFTHIFLDLMKILNHLLQILRFDLQTCHLKKKIKRKTRLQAIHLINLGYGQQQAAEQAARDRRAAAQAASDAADKASKIAADKAASAAAQAAAQLQQ